MRSTVDENIKEHSYDVAMIAHALVLIENKMYGASIDAHMVVCLALYHEAGVMIDSLNLDEIVGSVAGDDTLIIVTKSDEEAESVKKTLTNLL